MRVWIVCCYRNERQAQSQSQHLREAMFGIQQTTFHISDPGLRWTAVTPLLEKPVLLSQCPTRSWCSLPRQASPNQVMMLASVCSSWSQELALDRQNVEASSRLAHSWKNLCCVPFWTLLTHVIAWCNNSACPGQQGSLKRFHEFEECEVEVREKGEANCSPSASGEDIKRSKNEIERWASYWSVMSWQW